MDIKQVFDVLVVGGGHSGTEAAHAAARMGAKDVGSNLTPKAGIAAPALLGGDCK